MENANGEGGEGAASRELSELIEELKKWRGVVQNYSASRGGSVIFGSISGVTPRSNKSGGLEFIITGLETEQHPDSYVLVTKYPPDETAVHHAQVTDGQNHINPSYEAMMQYEAMTHYVIYELTGAAFVLRADVPSMSKHQMHQMPETKGGTAAHSTPGMAVEIARLFKNRESSASDRIAGRGILAIPGQPGSVVAWGGTAYEAVLAMAEAAEHKASSFA